MNMNDNKFNFFYSINHGVCYCYDPSLIRIIFNEVRKISSERTAEFVPVENIYPLIKTFLNRKHLYLWKTDLERIIFEIISFLIREPDIENFDEVLQSIESDLKKTLWPVLQRINNPQLLNILVGDILLELKVGVVYTAKEYTEKVYNCGAYESLYYYELNDIIDSVFAKLNEMKII